LPFPFSFPARAPIDDTSFLSLSILSKSSLTATLLLSEELDDLLEIKKRFLAPRFWFSAEETRTAGPCAELASVSDVMSFRRREGTAVALLFRLFVYNFLTLLLRCLSFSSSTSRLRNCRLFNSIISWIGSKSFGWHIMKLKKETQTAAHEMQSEVFTVKSE